MSREASTDDITEEGDELEPWPLDGKIRPDAPAAAPARLQGGLFGHELTPPMRLAAIVVIAAVSALVLTGLLIGARELSFLIQQMTA